MADYNIYIRSVSSGGYENPTQPWGTTQKEQNQTASWNEMISGASQGLSMGSDPSQLVSMGAGSLGKMIPAVAVAFAVLKITEKIVDKTWSFVGETRARQQGDYSVSHAQNNLKQLYRNISHPFSTTINIMIEEDNRRIENDKRYLQRSLLGDTIVNRGI